MTEGLAREVGRAKAHLSKSGVRAGCTARYHGLALLTSRLERYEGLLLRAQYHLAYGLIGKEPAGDDAARAAKDIARGLRRGRLAEAVAIFASTVAHPWQDEVGGSTQAGGR